MKKTVIFSTIGITLWLIGLFIDIYNVVTGDTNISLNFVVISLIRVMCIILPNVMLCVKKIDFKKISVPKYLIKEINIFETYFLPYLRWDTICSLFGNLTMIFATLFSIKRK